jgi:hypothetical protein
MQDARPSRLARASFIVSICALIASLASPFISYYWLQGSLRLYDLKRSSFSAEGEIGTTATGCEGIPATAPTYADYDVALHNDGSLPIEKVRVLIEKRRYIKSRTLDPKVFKAFPPAPFAVESSERVITFRDALPPHSFTLLTLTELQLVPKHATLQTWAPDVWVFSEVSGKSILWSAAYVWENDCP